MALPAPGYLSDPNRTNAEMQVALEDQRDVIYGYQINGKTELRAFPGSEDGQQGSVLLGNDYMRVKWDAVSTADDDDVNIFEVAGTPTGRWLRVAHGAYSAKDIGEPFGVWDHLTGVEPPDNSGAAKFVRLTAGQDGPGEYNEGLLINETITGSGPTIEIAAEIATGPLAGQAINLLNSENRYLMPGENSGDIADDQMQQITGSTEIGNNYRQALIGPTGAISEGGTSTTVANNTQGSTSASRLFQFDSANSPNARTGDRTNVKHIQVTYYMRIA